MGGAKFMGRDKGTTLTKGQNALGLFFVWLIGGMLISFFISMLIFSKPNLIFPNIIYFSVGALLFKRYLNIDKKEENGQRET